jgi:hypothetical protein
VPVGSNSRKSRGTLFLTYGGLGAYYGLELNPRYNYFVDTVEDTYVERWTDGYLVHLFDYEWPFCGSRGQHLVETWAVDLHVTFQGYLQEVSEVTVYEIPFGKGCLY